MKTVARSLVIALAVVAGASAATAMPKIDGAKAFFAETARTGS